MHIGIYNRLLELARAGRLTAYSDIAPLAGLSMTNDAEPAVAVGRTIRVS
jgi:hypothetical protein